MALMTYDAAGNLLQDGTGTGAHAYTWDAEGRLLTVDGGTEAYAYNVLGQRVQKRVSGVYTSNTRDAFGRLIAHDTGTSQTQIFQWLDNKMIGYFTTWERFTHTNALGSVTALTDVNGYLYQEEQYFPWGQQWTGSIEDDHFAGMDKHDAETGLDPTQFRMMSSTQGRWLSPDPLAGDVTNPQSLNRYAYVLNNPTNFIDPLGLDCATDFPGQSCIDSTSTAPFLPESGFSLSTIFCFMGFGDCGGSTQTQWYPTATPPASTNGNSGGSTGSNSGGTGSGSTGTPPSATPKKWTQTAGCFLKGAGIGALGAVAIGGLAAGAVTLGAPVAVVTGVVGVVAVAGGAAFGWDIGKQVRAGNWNGVAYDLGSVAGSSAVGGLGGRALAERINGVPSPPWSWKSDAAQGYNPNLGSTGEWMGTGPNPGSAGGSVAAAGTGAAQAAPGGC